MPIGGVFEAELVECHSGFASIIIPHYPDAFAHEAGGHRWQRIPPTEKRGRVHTSTITVATLPEPSISEMPEWTRGKDFEVRVARGSGPGGQNRNKVETAVTATHLRTGLQSHCESERSQQQNLDRAVQILRARVFQHFNNLWLSSRASERRLQVGSGERGDKRRTIRVRDAIVTDHIQGKKWALAAYLQGDYD